MELKRNGSQPSSKGPDDWFTGNVRIDPLFPATDRMIDRTVDLDGVPDGYRAMNDRDALKVLVRP